VTPPAPPGPNRRTVLRVGAGLGAVGVLVGFTGCARGEEGPDALEAPLAAARADASLAAAAAAAFPDLAGRLTPVAEARRAHAEALAQEVRRARPDRAAAVDAAPGATSPAPPGSAAALTAVRSALGRAGDTAGTLARGTEPYRCGLLASIAACCAGHVVDLA
jgi:hypothetical protein